MIGTSVAGVLILLGIFIIAGMVQGAAGFGFGLVAVALMSLLVDVRDASVMLAPSTLAMNLYILLRLREHFTFDRIFPLLVAAVVGVPLGIWFLLQARVAAIDLALGILLLLAVVQGLIPVFNQKRWHPVFMGIPCGLLSGILAGAFASGGPPAVAYVVSQKFTRFRHSATLQVIFLVSSSVRILILGAGGLFTQHMLAFSVAGMACAIAGAWIGLHLLHVQSDCSVRYGVLFLLAALAFHKIAAVII